MAQEDVDAIRALLGEIGRTQHTVEFNEFQTTIGTDTVYVDYQDIAEVSGIWLVTDTDKSGTNYYTNGSYDGKFGKITLGTSAPSADTEIIASYVRRIGLIDTEIAQHFTAAQAYVLVHIWDEFDFSDTLQNYNVLGRETVYSLSSYWCLLALNMGNALQTGFNYRVEEFEIQTKLWGEGMIAEALLATYWDKAIQMLHALSYNVGEIESVSYSPLYFYLSGSPMDRVYSRRGTSGQQANDSAIWDYGFFQTEEG